MQHYFNEDTMLCNNCGASYNDSTAGETCNGLVQDTLEFLRGEIEQECISYGGIATLQNLREYIEPSDTVLLEWAGVPEEEL